MSDRAPKATAESEPKSAPAGRADSGKGNEARGSHELAGASEGGGGEGAEPPSSHGLPDASSCSDTKGKEACVIEESEQDLQKDGGTHDFSTGRHGMAKGASVLEEEEEEEEEELRRGCPLHLRGHIAAQSEAVSAISHCAPKTTAKPEPKSSPAGRADTAKGSESPCSDELAGASGGSGREGAEPPSSDGLADASSCSDTKGKEPCVIEEAEEDLQKDGGPHDASTGRHGMAKGAFVLEEEELRRVDSIALKESESSSDIEMEKKFACSDADDEECVSALAGKDFDDISDEQNYIVLKELDLKTVMSRIDKIMSSNLDTILEGKGYSFSIPKRGAMMMAFHEGHQLLVIKREGTLVREFNRDETMHMATVTVLVLSKIYQALKDGVTITNRDLFCSGKECFEKIEISDAVLYDVCCMLGCTMSALNVVSIGKGSVIGPLKLKFKNGYCVNCLEKPLEGMRIPNNILEAEIEIQKDEVDFILVLEKRSLFDHLCRMDFHTENKCIMITGDGKPDIGTQAFLKMLVDVTKLEAYALVDPDGYGVGALCTYAFGSTKMPDDNLGFPVPSICWLGILPGDMASLAGLDCSQFPNLSLKEQRILSSVLQHRRMVLPDTWIQMIEQLAFENTKTSFECLHSLGSGYLSKVFIPKLLRRKEMQTLSGVSEVTAAEERVDP